MAKGEPLMSSLVVGLIYPLSLSIEALTNLLEPQQCRLHDNVLPLLLISLPHVRNLLDHPTNLNHSYRPLPMHPPIIDL